MIDLLVTTGAGKRIERNLEVGRYTIGRSLACDIRIPDRAIARYHATLELGPKVQTIRAVGGQSLCVADKPAHSHGPLRTGDVISLGGSTIEVRHAPGGGTTSAAAAVPAASEGAAADEPPVAMKPLAPAHGASVDATAAFRGYAALTPLRKRIQEQVQTELDLYRRNAIADMTAEQLRTETQAMAEQVVAQGKVDLPAEVDSARIIGEVVAEAIGLGPIEPLLADDTITEIMVNGAEQVFIERAGRIEHAGVRFIDDRSLMSVIERIVTPLGRRIDEGMPMVDARLADGSRVHVIIPPLSLKGPTLTIRKFSSARFDLGDLVRIGSLSAPMAEFLKVCVEQRRNIVISGGTGSGKTTFLNALSNFIPNTERIVTIEDAAELRLAQEHIVSLEARPANVEGKGSVSIRELVRNALRMRPDRIVVGECRGGEALDMLQAMNTGHDGSLTTGHANSPRDLLSRLEVMVLMSGMDLPVRAIREQLASAVDIVVQQTRFHDGRRRITDIVEVDGMEGDVVLLQRLFHFEQQGVGAGGEVRGEFVGAGCPARFYSRLAQAGLHLDHGVFDTRAPAA